MSEFNQTLYILPVVGKGIRPHCKLVGDIDRYRFFSYIGDKYFIR